MPTQHNVHIFGATGYTGQELVRLLANHPHTRIWSASSDSSPNQNLGGLTPMRSPLVTCTAQDAIQRAQPNDFAFLCLPHGASRDVAQQLVNMGVKVIDLGSDHRGGPKSHPASIRYGLCELEGFGGTSRDETGPKFSWNSLTIVANPGCYPTSALIPLVPLLSDAIIRSDTLIIDAKSGTSGAGKQPRSDLMFSEQHDNFSAYSPGRSHRHVAEIDDYLLHYSGHQTQVIFTPHLLPVARGILSTIYSSSAKKTDDSLRHEVLASWKRAYDDCPFVWVLDEGLPRLHHVVGTNRIAMGCVATGGTLIIVSVIDNLIKGASGQAVQNFNRWIGVPDTAGLEHLK
jgi:N-acetyl-gamma-glutamyl-phosphate reductase